MECLTKDVSELMTQRSRTPMSYESLLSAGPVDGAASGPFRASENNEKLVSICANCNTCHPHRVSCEHLGFPYSSSLKPVLTPQPHHSVSNETAGHTHVRRPLQYLFRLYPRPTLHPHPYSCLCIRNLYYAVKLTFDMSTNPMLRHLHKPTFWH